MKELNERTLMKDWRFHWNISFGYRNWGLTIARTVAVARSILPGFRENLS